VVGFHAVVLVHEVVGTLRKQKTVPPEPR